MASTATSPQRLALLVPLDDSLSVRLAPKTAWMLDAQTNGLRETARAAYLVLFCVLPSDALTA